MTAPSSDRAGIRQVIRALRRADHVIIGGHDGEDFFEVESDVSEDVLIERLTACDSSTLHVLLPAGTSRHVENGHRNGHVYFVLGNDPDEVICDHSVNLGVVLDPLTESWWS